MGRRRDARELAVQAMYLVDVARLSAPDAFQIIKAGLEKPDAKMLAFARTLLDGAVEHRAEIDGRIQDHATNWAIDRMAAVDRNILRIAAYELIHRTDVPVSVAIDEALEIAKKLSFEDSSRFINGVLDKLKRYRKEDGAASDPKGGA